VSFSPKTNRFETQEERMFQFEPEG
jgi:hypothetical protein